MTLGVRYILYSYNITWISPSNSGSFTQEAKTIRIENLDSPTMTER